MDSIFETKLNIEGLNVEFKIYNPVNSMEIFNKNNQFGKGKYEGVFGSLIKGLQAKSNGDIDIYGAFVFIDDVPVMIVSVKVLQKYRIAIPHGIQKNNLAENSEEITRIRENKIYLSLYLHMFWSYFVLEKYPAIQYLLVKPVGSMKHILLNRMGDQYNISVAIGMKGDMHLDDTDKSQNQLIEYKRYLENEISNTEELLEKKNKRIQKQIKYKQTRISTIKEDLKQLIEDEGDSSEINELEEEISRIQQEIDDTTYYNPSDNKKIKEFRQKMAELKKGVMDVDYITNSPTFKSLILLREHNLLFDSPFDYSEKDYVTIRYTDNSSGRYPRKAFKQNLYTFGGEHFDKYHWGDGAGAGIPYVTVKIKDLHDNFENLLTCEESKSEDTKSGYKLRF